MLKIPIQYTLNERYFSTKLNYIRILSNNTTEKIHQVIMRDKDSRTEKKLVFAIYIFQI